MFINVYCCKGHQSSIHAMLHQKKSHRLNLMPLWSARLPDWQTKVDSDSTYKNIIRMSYSVIEHGSCSVHTDLHALFQ